MITLQNIINQIEADQSCDLAELGFQFHHEVAICSGNIYYPMLVQTYEPLYILFYRMSLNSEKKETILKCLKDILEAVKSQDTEMAEKVIAAAIERWMRSLGKTLKK